MWPRPWGSITLSACLQQRYVPRRLIAIIASQSSVRNSISGPKPAAPALVTGMSRRPHWVWVRANRRSTSRSSPTSVGTTRAVPPPAVMSWETTSRVCCVRAASTTWTPDCARERAVARPIPEPAPVTTAARPCKSGVVIPLLAVVLEEILGGFPQADSRQAGAEFRFEQVPDDFDDVLAGGVQPVEFGGVLVEVFVVEAFDHLVLDRLHQTAEIHDHAGAGVNVSADGDL